MRFKLPYTPHWESPTETDSTVDKIYTSQGFGDQQFDYSPFKGHQGLDNARRGVSFSIHAMFEELCVGSYYHLAPDSNGDGREDGYGNICITHAKVDGEVIEIRHAHLRDRIAIVGETYKQGHLLGNAGATGNANGIHDHLEIIPIRPEAYGRQTFAEDRLLNDNGYFGRVNPLPYVIKANNMSNVIFVRKGKTQEYGFYVPAFSEDALVDKAKNFGREDILNGGQIDFTKAKEVSGL